MPAYGGTNVQPPKPRPLPGSPSMGVDPSKTKPLKQPRAARKAGKDMARFGSVGTALMGGMR